MLAERHTPLRAALAVLLGLAGVVTGGAAAPAATPETPGVVNLTLIVPIVVPENAIGLIPATDLEQYTKAGGLLTRQLDAVVDRPVALAIDPQIIASIRVLGSSAPTSATAWLARLAAAGNDTFALAYADADLTLASQAGAATFIQPLPFDFAIDPTLFAPATDATPAPDAPASPTTPGAPALPTGTSVIDWPYTVDGLAWPRDDSVVSTDLPTLGAAGYGTTILSSGNVVRDGDSAVVTVAGSPAAVADDTVSAAIRAAAASVTPESWQTAMADVSSALDAASPTTLATFDRAVPVAGSRLSETLSALQADPRVRMTPLSDLLADSAGAPDAALADSPQNPDRVARAGELATAHAAEERFATVINDPDLIAAPRRLALLALLSNVWSNDVDGWSTATDEFLADSTDLRSSVQVVAYTSFNLLADNAALPISVRNDLDFPVTVYITVLPDTALLAVTDSLLELVVEPNSEAKGQIPVQAVSNGTVEVVITLSSGAGVAVGDAARAEINVQAGWETPIVLIIAALVFLVFSVGIVRNILRRRSPRGTDATPAAGEESHD